MSVLGVLIILHSVSYADEYYVNSSSTNESYCNESSPCGEIQTAIGKATDNDETQTTPDTIWVSPGTYEENLRIEADMTILAQTNDDGDSTFINAKSIFGSVILIRPQSNKAHNPVVTIDGFVIQNGLGTEILEHIFTDNDIDPYESNMIRVGGGVFAYVCSPTITNCIFRDNGNDGDSGRSSSTTVKGGGIMASGDREDMDFPAQSGRIYTDHQNLPNAMGPLDLSDNVFINNSAVSGNSIMIQGEGFEQDEDGSPSDIKVVILTGSKFDVIPNPNLVPEGENVVSDYWVKGKNINFEMDEISGFYVAIAHTSGDVYVNGDGTDAENCGLTPVNSCKKFRYALSRVYATEDAPVTIHIKGNYNPSTGESFPISMLNNVSIVGSGDNPDSTVIDAKGSAGVLVFEDVENVTISNLTIRGGNYDPNYDPDEDGVNDTLGVGGGIYLRDVVNVSIEDVSLKSNIGKRGGGIVCINNNNSNPIIMNNIWIGGNLARSGSGIHVKKSNVKITNTTITGNAAFGTTVGAGIYCVDNSTLILTNVIIEDNFQSSGIYINQSTPILEDVTIDNNDGYGIKFEHIEYTDNLDAQTLIIENNGLHGIYFYNSNVELSDMSIIANKEGGIKCENSDPRIFSSIIKDHNPDNGSDIERGAGLYCINSSPKLTDVRIANNEVYQHGGGVYLGEGSDVEFDSVAVVGNRSPAGGGIYMTESDPEFINYCRIDSNSSVSAIGFGNGGGIYMTGSEPLFTDVSISHNGGNNTATGGGLYITGESEPILTNVLISHNNALLYGGSIFNSDAQPYILNSTITNNSSGIYIQGFLVNSLKPVIVNSILWDNSNDEIQVSPDEVHNSIFIYNSVVKNIEELTTDIGGEGWSIFPPGVEGENIEDDPNFTDTDSGDYTLQGDSPCIDYGVSNYVYDGDTIIDLDEDEYFGDAPDLGAFENDDCVQVIGDVNGDGNWDVLDIVSLANCVLAVNCDELEYSCAADVNLDGSYNVLDIVILANCVLAVDCDGLGRSDDANHSQLILRDNILSIEADGFIGGVQMTLKHGDDFSITMTNLALHADYLTEGNETRLLVITPETAALFSYSGDFEITEIIVANSHAEIDVDLPFAASFSLGDAYPNPFNPTTTLNFALPKEVEVSLKVYNLQGREVVSLVNGNMDAGYHSVIWNADSHASGIYFVNMIAGEFVSSQKLILVK